MSIANVMKLNELTEGLDSRIRCEAFETYMKAHDEFRENMGMISFKHITDNHEYSRLMAESEKYQLTKAMELIEKYKAEGVI